MDLHTTTYDVNFPMIAVHSLLMNCILLHRLRPYVCFFPQLHKKYQKTCPVIITAGLQCYTRETTNGYHEEWKMETTKGLSYMEKGLGIIALMNIDTTLLLLYQLISSTSSEEHNAPNICSVSIENFVQFWEPASLFENWISTLV